MDLTVEDATAQAQLRARLTALLAARGDEFGLRRCGETGVTRIGAGESYEAWRVSGWRTPTGDAVVIRVVRRPVSQLPRPMAAEFAFLRLVPPDLGSQGVHLEESADDLGAPFMIVTLVPGSVVRPRDWKPRLVAAHAVQLARLHTLPPPADAPRHPISIAGFCSDSAAWWEGAHPRILAAESATVHALRRAAEDLEWAFAGVVSDTLIHGDAVVTNILVAAGTPRYVDWEWAEFSDPARDLGLFGGAIACDPWYVALTPPQLRDFVATYAAAAGREDGDRLLVRQSAWELADRTFNALYCRLVAARGDASYAARADALFAGLRIELLRRGYW